MNDIVNQLYSIAPVFVLTIVTLLVLVSEALLRRSESASYWLSVGGLIACIALTFGMDGTDGTAFNAMIRVGGFANYFTSLFLIAALFTVIISREYLQKEHANCGEFYLLILFSVLGMILMAAGADLIMVFLGLELMSVCLYVLAGFFRRRLVANESSLKYFLLGAFATGFLLYGIALIYGISGTTNIDAIIQNSGAYSGSVIFWAGVALLLVGLAFKVGAVPFHMWIPDVYQGSPTPVAGFMATGSKAAAFGALVLIFAHGFDDGERLKIVLAILAAASMILGNIVAIAQTNIKRMLAYSSVAHAGYILAGLAAANELGRHGILFYLITYTLMNIGAFGILSLLEREEEQHLTFDDYAGLGTRKPFLAALMTTFMISLAGLPPFAGFFAKYYVFVAAVNADLTWLVVIGVMTSVVSVYYYLRLVMMMYFHDGIAQQPHTSVSATSLAVLTLAAIAIVGLGVNPSSLLSIIQRIG